MNDRSISPVEAAEFARALAAVKAPQRYIVAVSGGPDSMALMRLAAQRAQTARQDVLAVTVDHGLRPASAGEAEEVGRWCRAAGVDHKTLVWEGEKPATGVQQAARSARYGLLTRHAAGDRYDAILTAHTADDQAETAFMRIARGAGPLGLAAMQARRMIAAGPERPVALLRPLLEIPRCRLSATLAAFGQDSIADPSNDDPGFERVRTRALLAALSEQGLLSTEALCRTAARMRAAADRIRAADDDFFERAGGEIRFAWISLKRWEKVPPGLAARIIHAAGGGDYPPAEDAAAAALATAADCGTATLAGAMLKRHRDRLFAFREPAALFGRAGVPPIAPMRLAPGERLLWDGRFIVATDEASSPLAVVPAGEAASRDEALEKVPTEALQTCPKVVAADQSRGGAARIHSLLEERFSGRILRFR